MSRPISGGGVDAALRLREDAGRQLAADAESVAATCRDMAVRFHRGGKLVVFGNGGASADAAHIVVEFVHPVIVGKRALPAISLNGDVATITGIGGGEGFAEIFAHQMRHLADPADIALGLSPDGNCPNVRRALAAAREMGLLTIALTGGDGGVIAAGDEADHVLVAHTDNPVVVKEIHVTMYHILWELVHVFFERPGALGPGVVS